MDIHFETTSHRTSLSSDGRAGDCSEGQIIVISRSLVQAGDSNYGACDRRVADDGQCLTGCVKRVLLLRGNSCRPTRTEQASERGASLQQGRERRGPDHNSNAMRHKKARGKS
jgi:hypothetical protein